MKQNINAKKANEIQMKLDLSEINQLLDRRYSKVQLKKVHDQIVCNYRDEWRKDSFLAKAYSFHSLRVGWFSSNKLEYDHLLISELILNLGIISKKEYLEKCNEFAIAPFVENKDDKTDYLFAATNLKETRKAILECNRPVQKKEK